MGTGCMSKGTGLSWQDCTVISEEELFEHIFESGNWENNNTDVTAYCVRPDFGTINYSSFVSFIKDKFPYFVFPEEKVQDFEYALHESQQMTDYKDDAAKDGKWGEMILFLMVDGIFNLPMVSHKISWKQNPSQEVKGSDGLFFGEFEGDETLAIGEAKIYTNVKQGVNDALESTDRFHGSGSQVSKEHELKVASKNLSENLTQEQIAKLAETLGEGNHQYKMIHPIFIGYEENELRTIQREHSEDEEIIQRIRQYMEDNPLLDEVDSKLSNHPRLEKYQLIFLFLPVEDADDFRDRIKEEIYPYST